MSTTASKAAPIDSLSEATRYFSELAASVGFDEAQRRLQPRATPSVARSLEALKVYVRGGTKPPRELELYGEYFKHGGEGPSAIAGAATINAALREARALADAVRVGLPGDLAYTTVLLTVAAIVATMWFVYIAPSFVEMFGSLAGARLPTFSQALLDRPWLVFAAIGILALLLVLLIAGTWRVARAVEAVSTSSRWVRWIAGSRVFGALEQWRVATLASALATVGRAPLRALHDAVAAGGAVRRGDVDALMSRIELADELGIAEQELEHERERSLRDCRVALEVRRGVALRGMQLAVAALVGAVVIAIYLPIFSMGAVV